MKKTNAPGLLLHPYVIDTHGSRRVVFSIIHRDPELGQPRHGLDTWIWPTQVWCWMHDGYPSWTLEPHLHMEGGSFTSEDLREIARNWKRMERMQELEKRIVSDDPTSTEWFWQQRHAFVHNMLGFCRAIGGVWYSQDAMDTGSQICDLTKWERWARESDVRHISYALGVCYEKYIAKEHAKAAARAN